MRLTQYINESMLNDNRVDKFIKDVKGDCKPFLSTVKNCKRRILYRGYNGKLIDKKTVRKDRKPKDTPIKFHKNVDEIFFKKWGWRPRSGGLFVTGSVRFSSLYGPKGIVFPVGKFKFLWNPNVHDLYSYMDVIEVLGKGDEIIGSYKDKDMCKAIKSFKEIMIDCKSYYVINCSQLIKYLTNDEVFAMETIEEVAMMEDWVNRSFF